MEWIDTHLHLLYPEKLHYDWTDNLPPLRRAFRIEDYEVIARDIGLTSALHMEVDVRESEIEQETEWIAVLKQQQGKMLVGAISACRPELTDRRAFAGFVERSLCNPLIKGFRRVLHTQPDELSTSEHFREGVGKLTKTGKVFELCVLARQLDIGYALAKHLPNSIMVLNHGGVPDIAGKNIEPWRQKIKLLACCPNVTAKISGLIAYGDLNQWPEGNIQAIVDDLRPYFETLIEAFGWERVVWGSDFPVCTLTRGLKVWKKVTDILLEGESEDNIAALAYKNTKRIYAL